MQSWVLHSTELAFLIEAIRSEFEGRILDRISVLARSAGIQAEIKDEYLFEFSGRSTPGLVVSLAVDRVFIGVKKAPYKRVPRASLPAWILKVQKELTGVPLTSFQAVSGDRIAQLHFKGERTLSFFLFPKRPEAVLTKGAIDIPEELQILAKSRDKLNAKFQAMPIGEGKKAVAIREELLMDPRKFAENIVDAVQDFVREEASRQRLQAKQAALKVLEKKIAQAQKTLQSADRDAPWEKYGDAIKAHLHLLKESPVHEKESLSLPDAEGKSQLLIPLKKGMSWPQLLQHFYGLAKKRDVRRKESSERLVGFQEELHALKVRISEVDKIIEPAEKSKSQSGPRNTSKGAGLLFLSKEGLWMRVGRNKKENQKVTFECAKGNDLWLHVKARPGSHVVVEIPTKKTASLETLLDAAVLCLYFSDGKNWGKVAVDYTYRKYVKKILKGEQVSYTHEKSLMVEFDGQRFGEMQKRTSV